MAWYDDILGSGVNIFGAAPPSYLGGEGGLLNTTEMDKLKQKSLISGLLNTGLTYLAQPKNQRYGSALPYLAKAGIAGVGASQNVYDQASQDYMTKAKIEELQAGKTYATQLLGDPRVKGRPELEMMARKDPAKLFEYLNPKKEYKQVGNELISVDPYSGATANVYTGKPTLTSPEIENLYAFMDTLPPNDPRRASVQKIIDELPKKGSTNINNYPAGVITPNKEGQNKLDEVLLTSGDRLMQINRIQANFKPEYLTIGGKGENAFLALKDKWGTEQLDPKQKLQLENFTKFKQGASEQLNSYIKSVTGATIGEDEADRLMAATMNAGQGIFDGDSPTQFKSKLDNTIMQLKYAEARAAYIKKHGFTLGGVGSPQLSDVPLLMKKREQEIIQQYKLDTSKESDKTTLKTQLGAEFGLMTFSK